MLHVYHMHICISYTYTTCINTHMLHVHIIHTTHILHKLYTYIHICVCILHIHHTYPTPTIQTYPYTAYYCTYSNTDTVHRHMHTAYKHTHIAYTQTHLDKPYTNTSTPHMFYFFTFLPYQQISIL